MTIAVRDESHGRPAMFALGSADLVADALGALYWPQERLLAVADLHLEKGSAFAARRVFLPPYDTAATLAALSTLVARYAPRTLVALGDSFHDVAGATRLPAQFRASLRHLQTGRHWIWIAGNHDPSLPDELGGTRQDALAIGDIIFRHAPRTQPEGFEIAGHLHPVARVAGSIGSVRRRCFLSDARRCILPAFGAYAGGLNLHDPAFERLFSDGERIAHVIGRERVYKISPRHCLRD
jgi:uncharacterized protein